MKRILIVMLCLLLCLSVFTGCSANGGLIGNQSTYDQAVQLLQEGKLQEAYDLFLTIDDYRDVPKYLEGFSYVYETSTSQNTNGAAYTMHCEYDAYGRLIRSVKDQHTASGNQFEVVRAYTYDDQGNVVEFKYKRGSTYDYATRYEYDQDRNMIKIIHPDGQVYEYTHDKQGNVLTEVMKDELGLVFQKHIYQYNRRGDVIEETIEQYVNNITSSLTYRWQYDYDGKGNIRKKESDGYYETFEYDENGRVTHHVIHRSQLDQETVQSFKYDSHGNVIEHHYDSGKNEYTHTYEFEYDAHGNVLSVISYSGGEVFQTETYSGYKLCYSPYGKTVMPEDGADY